VTRPGACLVYYRDYATTAPPGVSCFCERCTPAAGTSLRAVPVTAETIEAWDNNPDTCDTCGRNGYRVPVPTPAPVPAVPRGVCPVCGCADCAKWVKRVRLSGGAS